MKIARIFRRVVTLLVLAGAAFGGLRYYHTPAGQQLAGRVITLVSAKQPDAEFVPTTLVRTGGFDVSLVAVGALKAKESRTVVADTSGTVITTVEDGTRVKKGDTLLELQNDMLVRQLQQKDTELVNAKQKLEDTKRDRTLEWQNASTQFQKGEQELQLLKTQNKSAIEQAEAQLEFQKTDLALARVQYSKNQRLAEEKLVPQTQVDADAATVKSKEYADEKGRGDLDLKKGQLASDELQKQQEVNRLKFAADMAKGRIDSEVKNAQINVDTITKQREDLVDQIKKSVITAPGDGIVVLASRWESGTQRSMRPGDQVGRNQKVCELPDLSHMQVSLEVEQKDIGPIRVGLPVRIRLDPFPDRVYHGQVVEVATVAKAGPSEGNGFMDANKNTFTTLIDIQEKDPEHLRPGMNATLEIYSTHLDEVTYIPLEGLFHKDDRPIVYLQQVSTRGASGHFQVVPLKLGDRNKDKVVVRSGLRPGQRIALVPPPTAAVSGEAAVVASRPEPSSTHSSRLTVQH